ncbi:MAG: FixH family protein [Vicingus serpentipes]|nr:FixH family protein [Vicingus serpentipes]
MKINWGAGAFIFFGAFVIFMFGLVYLASQQSHELVTENYYEKELAFKETLKKQEQTKKLTEQLSCNIKENQLIVKFPKEVTQPISGKLFFFKPSNEKNDQTIPFETATNEHIVDITTFSSGMYKLKIDWQTQEVAYFNEKVIVIP